MFDIYREGSVGYEIKRRNGLEYLERISNCHDVKVNKNLFEKLLHTEINKFYCDYFLLKNEINFLGQTSFMFSTLALVISCMNYAGFFNDDVFMIFFLVILMFFIVILGYGTFKDSYKNEKGIYEFVYYILEK